MFSISVWFQAKMSDGGSSIHTRDETVYDVWFGLVRFGANTLVRASFLASARDDGNIVRTRTVIPFFGTLVFIFGRPLKA